MSKIPKIEGGANIAAVLLIFLGFIGLPVSCRFINEVTYGHIIDWNNAIIILGILAIACPLAAMIISIISLVKDHKCTWARTIIALIVFLVIAIALFIWTQSIAKSINNLPPPYISSFG